MPRWITSRKQTFIRQIQNHNVDISTFSAMQSQAFNLVQEHFQNPHSQAPLHLIINGEAGTGKSYLINALRNFLGKSCIVTATTGKASFNIDAVTIHSLLSLPVGSRGNSDLKGQSLSRLQIRLTGCKYILIDEYSMLGQRLFGWVDKRCRQATGKINQVFGNISLILFGDPVQLPPVADKPLYHNKPTGALGDQGYLAYLMFSKVIKLSVNQRVQGSDVRQVTFKNFLRRLRNGDCTQEDWQLLLTRQPSKVQNLNDFHDAIRLFYGNNDVASFNYEQLLKLKQPIACIQANIPQHLPRQLKLMKCVG